LLIFEMGTVLPVTSRELPLDTSKSGVQVMDIAISGSTPAAELGTLTSLVGGNADVFQAALPGALRASGPVEESRQDFARGYHNRQKAWPRPADVPPHEAPPTRTRGDCASQSKAEN
jgi:hypothetical protein